MSDLTNLINHAIAARAGNIARLRRKVLKLVWEGYDVTASNVAEFAPEFGLGADEAVNALLDTDLLTLDAGCVELVDLDGKAEDE